MHSPTEQDVLDLMSVPSTHVDTSSSIINAYLNPEFQYNLQLSNLTNCLNATPTAPIDLFWSATQQSSPTTTNDMSDVSVMAPQRFADSKFPTNGPNNPALSQQEVNISQQLYLPQNTNQFDQDQQSFLSGSVCAPQPPQTPAAATLKYHRSMSHIYQPFDHQQPLTPSPSFIHRASLPNIYPVNDNTGRCHHNNHTLINNKRNGDDYSNLNQNTLHTTINANAYNSNDYYNAIPLLTWNQSPGNNYHNLRPTPTLDDSTRKRTKSMDHINHKSTKLDGQQQYQHYQHYTPFQSKHKESHHEMKECHYRQQQKHQQTQHKQQYQQQHQQLQCGVTNIKITLDQNSAQSCADERVINALNPLYQQHHSSPPIKSPMSAASSLSTISSTNTTKHADDDLFDKEGKQHTDQEMVDSISSMFKSSDRYPDSYDINDIKSTISCNDKLDDHHYTCQNTGNMDAKLISADTFSSLHAVPSLPTNEKVPKIDPATHLCTNTSSTTSSSTSAPSSFSPSPSTTSSSSSSSSSAQTEYNYPMLSEADMDAMTHDTSAMPRRQNPRYDADAYTPRWVRYTGQQKQGYCESCQPMGKWLQLKNSAYWYHKQFFHGISSVSGQPFTSPLEQRVNKENDLLEGLCHQCLQFVPICNTKRKNSVLWYRHAHKCHIYDKPKPKASQQSNTAPQTNI